MRSHACVLFVIVFSPLLEEAGKGRRRLNGAQADGDRLAFAAGDQAQLMARALEQLEAGLRAAVPQRRRTVASDFNARRAHAAMVADRARVVLRGPDQRTCGACSVDADIRGKCPFMSNIDNIRYKV